MSWVSYRKTEEVRVYRSQRRTRQRCTSTRYCRQQQQCAAKHEKRFKLQNLNFRNTAVVCMYYTSTEYGVQQFTSNFHP